MRASFRRVHKSVMDDNKKHSLVSLAALWGEFGEFISNLSLVCFLMRSFMPGMSKSTGARGSSRTRLVELMALGAIDLGD